MNGLISKKRIEFLFIVRATLQNYQNILLWSLCFLLGLSLGFHHKTKQSLSLASALSLSDQMRISAPVEKTQKKEVTLQGREEIKAIAPETVTLVQASAELTQEEAKSGKESEKEAVTVTSINYEETQEPTKETAQKEDQPAKALMANSAVESVNINPALSKEDKIRLANLLLAENLKTVNQGRILASSQASLQMNEKNKPILQAQNPEPEMVAIKTEKKDNGQKPCEILEGHVFMRPQGSTQGTWDTQVCPERKEWLSIDQGGQGWVKLEGPQHFATLTRHPAPNGGPTILMDENAIAYVSIKSGVHIVKGAGLIAGLVPEGYKIEFLGRAEETQYFEIAKQKYFVILNAEPGAGVIELQSETDQNKNSTVFTPVLEDVVTYLDLSAPEQMNLGIQIDKNTGENQSKKTGDLAGLAVGVSTQKNIQAITLANGYAQLKNVNVVNGFPVFVDIGSKFNGEASYTYRYELNPVRSSQTKERNFIVKQESELNIRKWLRQVQHGLSEQSAMVIGYFNKDKLNGFKNLHFAQTQSRTTKLGLEPMSYTILWDNQISTAEPLEGDVPRFMSVEVPEGLSQAQLLNERHELEQAHLIPISPRVIHVISD